jgi:glycosyltransferase involved in cell wall biosynthesis
MKITIVIPVKNRYEDLKACLRSIQGAKQTHVIVVDDHSDQSIRDVLSDEFSWVEVYLNSRGKGIGMARNCGLDQVKSEYVMFVDSDDILLPGWEEIVLRDIEAHQNMDVLVYSPTSFNGVGVGERHKYLGELISKYLASPSEITLARLKYRSVSILSKVFKVSFLKSNMIEFGSESIGEDVLFTTKVGILTDLFLVKDDVWYQTLEHEGSHNNQMSQQAWHVRLQLVIDQAKLVKQHTTPELFKELHFPVKHYLTRAIKGRASWVDITKYVVSARRLGIW